MSSRSSRQSPKRRRSSRSSRQSPKRRRSSRSSKQSPKRKMSSRRSRRSRSSMQSPKRRRSSRKSRRSRNSMSSRELNSKRKVSLGFWNRNSNNNTPYYYCKTSNGTYGCSTFKNLKECKQQEDPKKIKYGVKCESNKNTCIEKCSKAMISGYDSSGKPGYKCDPLNDICKKYPKYSDCHKSLTSVDKNAFIFCQPNLQSCQESCKKISNQIKDLKKPISNVKTTHKTAYKEEIAKSSPDSSIMQKRNRRKEDKENKENNPLSLANYERKINEEKGQRVYPSIWYTLPSNNKMCVEALNKTVNQIRNAKNKGAIVFKTESDCIDHTLI